MKTALSLRDRCGTLRARLGIDRNRHKINPGLYCVGSPDQDSPVLVTANYKLGFDTLRRALAGTDAWLLVIDTRGINVWCAAGKGTFSADEIALQVNRAKLATIVAHRQLILPQLAAPGTASRLLPKKCAFTGIFGPVRAEDIPRYLRQNRRADEAMRSVTFSLYDRLVLVPVEITLIWKIFLSVVTAFFLLSGLGPHIFSLHAAWSRGLTWAGATVVAVLAGALATPALLPWIPGRQFWLKGLLVGGAAGLGYLFVGPEGLGERLSLLIWVMAAASYLAMNYTGATPYTSLSGVEYEMRRGLPVQIVGAGAALILWLAAPFLA